MMGTFSRRSLLKVGGLTAVAGVASPAIVSSIARAENRTLYVNTYGGELEDAWKKAFAAPFTAATGIDVKMVSPVNFATLRAEVQTKNYEWDLTCMGEVDFAQAEVDHLTEKIDRKIVNKVPESIVVGNGVEAYKLGTLLVYRKDKFPNGGPQSWPTSGTSRNIRAIVVCTTVPSRVWLLRCSPMACRRNNSIRWISTVRSGKWTRSSRI
jgi:putative spermidine/putrescine transport system substrate-binding protein